jgi:penicillin-binding protein 1C
MLLNKTVFIDKLQKLYSACSIGFKKNTFISLILLASIWMFDKLFPISLNNSQQHYAQIIVAEDGTPLRAFADHNGIWRYPIRLNEVSPLYLQALLNYEDRWFWQHPGVNPLAFMRALLQNLTQQHIISGGSTLTMQVARLVIPQSKGILGKIGQVLRALQLEAHYSKREILQYYLNHAPFGGTLEGVQAASYVYLDKSASELSHAEAALLAVLPQAPSRYRPDRHPEQAQAARDKVIQRLVTEKIWLPTVAYQALQEQVYGQRNVQPTFAPLLAQRFKQVSSSEAPLKTTLDYAMQEGLEDLVRNYMQRLPTQTSAAVLVVENSNLAVKTYIGSADFTDNTRFAHVDMISAVRSPGSTLKPFLYGLALDEGLIHSQSLLVDAPTSFDGYRPHDFDRGFIGPVSVSNALKSSLNVPAIQVLYHLGADKFVNQLKNAGLLLQFQSGAKPNLSVILGGVGTNLETLVSTYTALANSGIAGKVRFLKDSAKETRYLMSPGAAWIIRDILKRNGEQTQGLAWKTGTSYGYRDFWSVGVTNDYTIGVWIGRPDGTAMPGHYGALTASPLLFEIAQRLSYQHPHQHKQQAQPDSVTEQVICWPLGELASATPPALCHEKKKAWLLNQTVPKTLSAGDANAWEANPATLLINQETGRLVDAACSAKKTAYRTIALWPLAVEPWIPENQHRLQQIGAYDASCLHPPQFQQGLLKIEGLNDQAQLRSAGAAKNLPAVPLQTSGAQGWVYWFINGQLLYKVSPEKPLKHQFTQTGHYQIAVTDEMGKTASIEVDVFGALH